MEERTYQERWWCQFCDKEMRFKASVVESFGYETCGAGKCLKKASKTASAYIAQQHQALKKASSIVDFIAVFRTKTPDDEESWEAVLVDDHPEFMKNLDDCLKAIEGGVIQDDEDEDDWWYFVIPTDDIIDAVKDLGIPMNIEASNDG